MALSLVAMTVVSSCATRKPLPNTPIQAVELAPEERLGIDDVFQVRVFGEPDLTADYRVAADGTIDYPFVGRCIAVILLGNFAEPIAGLNGIFSFTFHRLLSQDLIGEQPG